MADRAISTRIGCGSPDDSIDRASESTDGGRTAGTAPPGDALARLILRSLRFTLVSLPIDLVRLDEELPLPAYAHSGDAGIDLFARHDALLPAAGGRLLMPTGVAIAIPDGYCGLVLPRSGLALKYGISVVNAPGLVDSTYRGELKVVLLNTDPIDDYEITRGDRIAQIVIQKVEHVQWNVVTALGGDDRGGGFGHSGR